MQFLRDKVKELRPLFEKGGKFEKFYFVYEAHETLFFQPDHVTGPKGAHIRDANDMKRTMVTVILAMIPCLLFGVWNVGHQHFIALSEAQIQAELGLGILDATLFDKVWFGLLRFIPILAVSYGVGLGIEFAFATIYRHPVAEGFLVSGMLIPLIVPSTIPLWQVGIATAFAVVLGKEVFGGTGMNLLNPALTARAFLFFAYPAQISGDKVWVDVDGYSAATVLGDAAAGIASSVDYKYSFMDMFLGFIPGSIGETSTLMCIVGAIILIGTGVGSWRIIFSMILGALALAWILEAGGVNFFGVDHFYYHLVAGGFAFGTVFMATDPVSASQTNTGKLIYGFMAGGLSILVRVVNPAYPEGVMLAILLMNVLAPLVDYFVISANKNRRLKRATV